MKARKYRFRKIAKRLFVLKNFNVQKHRSAIKAYRKFEIEIKQRAYKPPIGTRAIQLARAIILVRKRKSLAIES